MASGLRAETLVASIKATGLKIDQITSRDDLAQKLATIKTLAADANKCDYTLIDMIKFGWKVVNPVDPRVVKPDMGYPDSLGDLKMWAWDHRFPHVEKQDEKGYLEYITSGQFKVEKKDWGEYVTGVPTEPEAGKEVETEDSEFFYKKHLSDKPAPVTRWRRAAARSREILAHYIMDPYIKVDFLFGKFSSWKELEDRYKIYIDFSDLEETHQRTIVGLKDLKQVMQGSQNPRQKFGAIQTILRPYLCYDDGDVENSVWGSGNEQFRKTGSEDFSPLLNELIKWLASWSLSNKDYEEAENEFLKEFKSLKPEILSKNRHKFLEFLCKQSKKGGSRISAVRDNTDAGVAMAPSDDLEQLQELNDDEFEKYVADFFADDGPTGKILAIRENRNLNNRGFRKKSNKNFSRFKNLANNFGQGQGQGVRQSRGGQGNSQASGGRSLPMPKKLPKGKTYANTACTTCTNDNPPRFHSLADCPKRRGVRQVQEVVNQTDQDETQAMEDAYRAVWEDK